MREKLELWLLTLITILHITVEAHKGIVFWWAKRRGRGAWVEQRVREMARNWARGAFRRVRCEVEVQGAEHLVTDGPLIVMSNHQDQYDIPLLMGYLGRMVGFVAKKELFRIPGLAFWMRAIHSIPLDRADIRGSAKVYDTLGRTVKENGWALVLFPEGTRSRDPDGAVAPFKRGSLRVAEQHRIPIQPVSLDGTRFLTDTDALRRTRHGGRLVRLRIHPAVYPEPMSAPESKRFMENIQETVVRGREAIRVSWPAPGDSASPAAEAARATREAAGQ